MEPNVSAPAPEPGANATALAQPTSREDAAAKGFMFVTNVSTELPEVQRQTADYLIESGYEVYIDPVALDEKNQPIDGMASLWRRRPPAPPASPPAAP